MARAAAAAGVPLVVSSNAGSTFADIAADRRHLVAPGVRRRRPRGHRAAAPPGRRRRRARDRAHRGHPRARHPLRRPGRPTIWEVAEPGWVGANSPHDDRLEPADRAKAMDLGPADISWLTDATLLPVVVKGVLRADDARRCVDAGAAAVWVSNHGGRQLDRVVATAHCVASVREAVAGRCRGVRRRRDPLRPRRARGLAPWAPTPSSSAARSSTHWPPEEPTASPAPSTSSGPKLVESLRLAGCSSLAQTPGIACRYTGDSTPDRALTCVNSWCDRGHSEPI